MTARVRRRATDALLVITGLLLVVAVVADVGRRITLQQRMRVDRHALRVYLQPRTVDPHLMTIALQGKRDLVCAPGQAFARRPESVCVHVAQTAADAGHVLDAHRAGPIRRRSAARDGRDPSRAVARSRHRTAGQR